MPNLRFQVNSTVRQEGEHSVQCVTASMTRRRVGGVKVDRHGRVGRGLCVRTYRCLKHPKTKDAEEKMMTRDSMARNPAITRDKG